MVASQLKMHGRLMIFSVILIVVCIVFIVNLAGTGSCAPSIIARPTSIVTATPTPSLGISPSPATVGETVTITGQHFTPKKTLSLYIKPTYPGASPAIYTQTADGTGGFTYKFTAQFGQYYVYAQDSSGSYSNQLTLTVDPTPTAAPTPAVKPTITVSPRPATVGQTVQVKGQGFTPSKTLTLYMKPTYPGATPAGYSQTSDGSGAFTYTFTAQFGQYEVYAQDSSGSYSNMVVLTVDPASDQSAQPVTPTPTVTPVPGQQVTPTNQPATSEGTETPAGNASTEPAGPSATPTGMPDNTSGNGTGQVSYRPSPTASSGTGNGSSGLCAALLLPVLLVGLVAYSKSRKN